jgi:hypothetical protein
MNSIAVCQLRNFRGFLWIVHAQLAKCYEFDARQGVLVTSDAWIFRHAGQFSHPVVTKF